MPTHVTDPRASRRRSYQFSVRMLLLLTTLAVVGLAWYVAPQQSQNRTISAIERLGGSVIYKFGTNPQGVDLTDFSAMDRVLAQVRNLQSVESLNLGRWWTPGDRPVPLTRAGLDYIASTKSLVSVRFIGFDITDATIMELAERLPHLNSLEVYECPNITDAGVDRFGERFPLIEIRHRLP